MKLEPIPEYCDLIEIESFIGCCEKDCFTNDDGTGYLATKDGMDRDYQVYASDVARNFIPPKWATHVAWFNK